MLTRPEAPVPSTLAHPAAISVASAAALAAIRDADVNLAVWARPVSRAVRREAQTLLAHAPFSAAEEATPDRLARAFGRLLPAPAQALVADIARLARCFAAIACVARVRVRLEALTGLGCPLFHADHVGLRLLSTYVGAGTEWVPEHAVRRGALGCGNNALIVPDRAAIRRLAPFAVGVFKGEAFAGNRGRGVVHRSAPASDRQRRLLLCLDEPGRF